MYFNNLKLKYRENKLLNEGGALTVGKREQGHIFKNAGYGLYEKPAREAKEIWSYRLKDDYVNDFFYDLRQWIKRYEEDLIFPVLYKDALILRNEYQMFCVDLLSGKEIWSMGGSDKSGCQYYQTFRNIHYNSYGYEFLLSGDMLFSELDGRLVAVTLENPLTPKVLWEKSLGEYTLCTKPIRIGDILVTGLINTRGELWACGFDCQRGAIEWSTYIGLSCFFSPVCAISAVADDKVFIGTNHGALICLNPNNGKITWLRKYTPKNYKVFEYWKSGRYNDKALNKGSIPYDTQFIETGDNNLLYYKPRESDYLYILDSRDGRARDEILLDSEKFYVIGVRRGKAIFLEKEDINKGKNIEIRVVELDSGRQIYRTTIKGGSLKGVFYPNINEALFKVGDTIHYLRIDNNNAAHAEVSTLKKGWLLNAEGRFLFVNDGKTLFCLDASGQKYPFNQTSSYSAEYLKQREGIKDNLVKALQADAESAEAIQLRSKLLSEVKVFSIPLEEVFPFIADNIEKLQHPVWQEFCIELQNLYGNDVVTFRDVEMKFGNFLRESGILYQTDRNNECIAKKDTNQHRNDKNSQFRVEKTMPLAVEIIKGQGLPGFFQALNRNQLLCINETGDILWERKLFYGPVLESDQEKNKGRHMYTDNIEAYLYDNVLIINDNINVVAMNMNDGSYIWSLTNKQEMFKKEIQLPPTAGRWPFEASRLFASNVMFYTKFLDEKLIVVHGNRVYSINPLTGYCRKSCELNMKGAMEIAIASERIYLLSSSLDSIKVLDKGLNLRGDFALNFIDRDKEVWPELFFVNNHIILHISPDVYVIDAKSGKLKDKLSMSEIGRYFLEAHKENLLAIAPFRRLINYRLEDGSLKIGWEFQLEGVDQRIMWVTFPRTTRYYFIVNDTILLPSRKGGDYFMASVDMLTGRRLWERRLKETKGLFYNLSNAINFNGGINFIISTIYTGGFPDEADIFKRVNDNVAVDIDSRLFYLRVADGKIINNEALPSTALQFEFVKTAIAETKNYLIYGIYGRLLKMVRR